MSQWRRRLRSRHLVKRAQARRKAWAEFLAVVKSLKFEEFPLMVFPANRDAAIRPK